MKHISATVLARNLSRVLDQIQHGGEEVVVERNGELIARLIPGAPVMTALEALGDLHRTLSDKEGASWLKDARRHRTLLAREKRDPWA